MPLLLLNHFSEGLVFESRPLHPQMGGKLEHVKPDAVDDHRQEAQRHIQAVAEHNQGQAQDEKQGPAQYGARHGIDRLAYGQPRQSHGPKPDVRGDVREHVDHPQEHRDDVRQARQDALDQVALVVSKDEVQYEAYPDQVEGEIGNGEPHGVQNQIEHHEVHPQDLQQKADLGQELEDRYPVLCS